MPELSRFHGIVIRMYWREHPPPHFHVKYADDEAQIDIATLAIIEGSLPRRVLKSVRIWGQQHQGELLEAWEHTQIGKMPEQIDGLP